MESELVNGDLEDSGGFESMACKLLKEYAVRIQKTKSKIETLLEKTDDYRGGVIDKKELWDHPYFGQKMRYEVESFHRSTHIYTKLIRKASQWLQHGKLASAGRQLELEIRLADLEFLLLDLEIFVSSIR